MIFNIVVEQTWKNATLFKETYLCFSLPFRFKSCFCVDEFYLTSFILRDLDEFEDYKDLYILYEVCNVSYYIYVYSKVRK